jgi:hypothetical protein
MSDIEIRSCKRCLTAARQNLGGGHRYDAVRGWRWIVARLNDDAEAEARVEDQVRDCPGCAIGFARYLAGIFAGTLIDAGKEAALAVAQHYLDQSLDVPDVSDLLTPPEPPGKQTSPRLAPGEEDELSRRSAIGFTAD